MITEDYVSFETAKLLKEKGFDEPCYAYWHEDENKLIISQSPYALRNITNPCFFGPAAPTLQMVMKWLREVHHLTIDVFHFRDWKVNIKTIPDDYFKADYSYPELKPAETYEQACETAIKYCLENLI